MAEDEADETESHLVESLRIFNERFYASRPMSYFEQRLTNLLAAASEDDEFGPHLREGIDIGGFVIGVDDSISLSSRPDPGHLMHYVSQRRRYSITISVRPYCASTSRTSSPRPVRGWR